MDDVSASRAHNAALSAAFRCQDELCSFIVKDGLGEKSGFFRFGADLVLYGRSTGPVKATPTADLVDVLDQVVTSDGMVVLPFDPNEIISNLLLERYVNRSPSQWKDVIYNAYYSVRPFLPVKLRRHLQKARLNASRKQAFPAWPLDFTADKILERLMALSLNAQCQESTPFVSFWPDNVASCAIMTHDVETDEGLRFCGNLMDIDDSFGIKSSFQLVPEERYHVTDRILSSFADRGFEVNVHDFNHDGRLYTDREQFLQRARAINDYSRKFGASGFRSGAMYRNLDWYDSFEFSYDMSVPSVGHLEAQAGGCCTVLPYFIGELVELPLTTTQDYSLFHILGQYSIDLWKQQIDALVERRGLISFIVHPDYIIERKAQDTYKALLAYLAQLREEGKLLIHRPNDVAQWWKQRSQTRLEYRNDHWLTLGPMGDLARVSYARVDDRNNLFYV